MQSTTFVPSALTFSSTASTFTSTKSTQKHRLRRPLHPRAARMCEPVSAPEKAAAVTDEALSAAEKTRRALSESEPLVKFRRDTDYLDENTDFTYTKGVESGVDIWLIAGVLTFLVPLIGFAIGVATGNIDVNPR